MNAEPIRSSKRYANRAAQAWESYRALKELHNIRGAVDKDSHPGILALAYDARAWTVLSRGDTAAAKALQDTPARLRSGGRVVRAG